MVVVVVVVAPRDDDDDDVCSSFISLCSRFGGRGGRISFLRTYSQTFLQMKEEK